MAAGRTHADLKVRSTRRLYQYLHLGDGELEQR
jgi:hypothetical protein